MLSIGQFSKVCQVSIKTLHHYDRIGLMKPCRVEEESGYRYYDREQIPTMLLIQRLKRYGFSLSEIREILCCSEKEVLFAKLEKQKRAIKTQLDLTFQVIREMESHIRNFERTGDIMGYQENYEIQIKNSEERSLLCSRQMMSVADFGKYFGKVYERIAREHLTVSGREISIYHDQEFNPESSDIEVAVPIKETEKADRVMPPMLCAVTVHKGSYSSLSDAYGALMRWVEQNGYEMTDSPFEVYLKSQFDRQPVEEWETEIYFPVKMKE